MKFALRMRIWREVRNFASQKFRLTPVIQPPTLFWNVRFSLFLLTSIVQNVRVYTMNFVSRGKNTLLLLYVTVCKNVAPRLNKHDDVIEWNFMKIAPPPEMKAWLRHCTAVWYLFVKPFVRNACNILSLLSCFNARKKGIKRCTHNKA